MARNGLPSRVPLVFISTIQLVPLHVSRMCSGASFARRAQVMSRPWLISSRVPLPQKGSGAFPGTGCGSDDAESSGSLNASRKAAPTPSGGSRPPAPGAAEKRLLGVECIRLDQHAVQVELADELTQHRPLMVLAGGLAGLTDRNVGFPRFCGQLIKQLSS